MRVLWHSDSAWSGTGYGNQTRLIVKRIQELGHEIAVSAASGLGGGRVTQEGILHYPDMYTDDHGVRTIWTNANQFGADVIISLKDLFVYDGFQGFNKEFPWSPIFPLHYDRLPLMFRDLLSEVVCPATLSRWGVEKSAKRSLKIDYVPHGIDTDLFCNYGDKESFKEMLGFSSSSFLVGMVGMNSGYPSRKSFPEAFEAVARLQKNHKDIGFYVHSDPVGLAKGIDLFKLGREYQLFNTRFANTNLLYTGVYTEEWIVKMYNAFDVLLCPSKGEGFGLPIIEAQSCGVPVIVNNFSSMPELLGDGWLCRVAAKEFVRHVGYQAIPSVKSIASCLEAAYRRGKDLPSQKARQFVVDNYNINYVFDTYFIPHLKRLEEAINKKRVEEIVRKRR